MLIPYKDDIKFVTEFTCFLGHPVEIDDYKWKIIPGRLFGGGSEAL